MIAVISHDAGGAEVLSSYVRRLNLNCLFVLDGPALGIFKRKLGPVESLTLEDALRQSTSIICGTSWKSDIEFNAIKLARSLGKRSIAFLDHWVNYDTRFIRSGETVFPDEIWVGDSMAEAIALRIFPDSLVKRVDNPYFQDVREEFLMSQMQRPSSPESIKILYVCEPISTHASLRYGNARFWGYVEEDAIRYFLSNIRVFGKNIDQILIRPHPSEDVDKYAWVKTEFQLPIKFGGGRSLMEEISESDVIVGCESMAMVIATIAGKKVISSIPPNGRDCVLPQTEIMSMQSILENMDIQKNLWV